MRKAPEELQTLLLADGDEFSRNLVDQLGQKNHAVALPGDFSQALVRVLAEQEPEGAARAHCFILDLTSLSPEEMVLFWETVRGDSRLSCPVKVLLADFIKIDECYELYQKGFKLFFKPVEEEKILEFIAGKEEEMVRFEQVCRFRSIPGGKAAPQDV